MSIFNASPVVSLTTLAFFSSLSQKCTNFIKISFLTAGIIFFCFIPFITNAAITEDGPVRDSFFENNPTIGGGAVMSLVQFRLKQESGSETFTKVGVSPVASTTLP